MKKQSLLAFLAVALSAGAFQAQAATTFVGTRGGLGANDSVDWGQLGPAFTTVPSGTTVTSAGGLTMTITDSAGSMERRDQSTGGWAGDFAPGDHLLWNRDNGGNINISFATGIFGLGGGAQVQADFFGSFTGTISAYDGLGNLITSYSFGGVSSPAGDNSAPFAGILDTTADIHKISFSGFNFVNGFAINQLDLVTTATVPDAGSTMSLMGLALFGLGLLRRSCKA